MLPVPLPPATAECSLIVEHSRIANELSASSLCRLGVNYGCYANGERKMWVRARRAMAASAARSSTFAAWNGEDG